MKRIAHIVSPVLTSPPGDLSIAQPITFETMRRARDNAKDTVRVELFCAMFPEDAEKLPHGFIKTKDLDRSVLDMHTFSIPRKLPLLKDILDRLYAASDAEYFIYTNVDIALMPSFYTEVQNFIDKGYDAFVITRRCISTQYSHIEEIPLMELDTGTSHQGHDCFVFRRDVYPTFILGDVCIGSAHVDLPIVCNMIANAKNFEAFTDLHLTFHRGTDKRWWSWKFRDYILYNDKQAANALQTLGVQKNMQHKLNSIYRLLVAMPILSNALCIRAWRKACNQ